jgi:hypothetical protein
MKATIVSRAPVPTGSPIKNLSIRIRPGAENSAPPYAESISLRTARVLVAPSEYDNAFEQMLVDPRALEGGLLYVR